MSQTQSPQLLPDPPRRMKAILWRLPIWFFRLKLGWMFGHRMLLLTHIGRISGKPRKAVLEVVDYDKDTNIHYVASGFGDQADWFKNISKSPQVTIQVANRQIPVIAEKLDKTAAEAVFKKYNAKNPKAMRTLAKLVGYSLPDSEDEMLAFFRDQIPIVSFRPR